MSEHHADLPSDPPSPCIGVCSLDAARSHCTGCLRTVQEIAGWLSFTPERKQQALDRIAAKRAPDGSS